MAYTPPTYNAIELNFTDSYTPPAYNAVALNLTDQSSGGQGTAIVGTSALGFSVSQPELWFPYVGTAALSITATASLTIHIELAGELALQLLTDPAELTIGYQVRGQVTEMGIPVQRSLRAYDAASGTLLVTGTSDPGTGDYRLDLFDHGDDIYVQCLGSALYGPLIHGPIAPERL